MGVREGFLEEVRSHLRSSGHQDLAKGRLSLPRVGVGAERFESAGSGTIRPPAHGATFKGKVQPLSVFLFSHLQNITEFINVIYFYGVVVRITCF